MNSACPVCDEAFAQSPHWVECNSCGVRSHPDCWERDGTCIECEGIEFTANDIRRESDNLSGDMFYPGSKIYVEKRAKGCVFRYRCRALGNAAFALFFGFVLIALLAFLADRMLGLVVASLLSPILVFLLYRARQLFKHGAPFTIEVNEEGIRRNRIIEAILGQNDRFQFYSWELIRSFQLFQNDTFAKVAFESYKDRDDIPAKDEQISVGLNPEESSRLAEELTRIGQKLGHLRES